MTIPTIAVLSPYSGEIITENWVDDVKEALIGCPENELIQNPDFDCIVLIIVGV